MLNPRRGETDLSRCLHVGARGGAEEPSPSPPRNLQRGALVRLACVLRGGTTVLGASAAGTQREASFTDNPPRGVTIPAAARVAVGMRCILLLLCRRLVVGWAGAGVGGRWGRGAS